MRISDWSSEVCSSDLSRGDGGVFLFERGPEFARIAIDAEGAELRAPRAGGGTAVDADGRGRRGGLRRLGLGGARQSDVAGTGVSVGVGAGGRRVLKKNTKA